MSKRKARSLPICPPAMEQHLGDALRVVFNRERLFKLPFRPITKQSHVGLLRIVDRDAKHLSRKRLMRDLFFRLTAEAVTDGEGPDYPEGFVDNVPAHL